MENLQFSFKQHETLAKLSSHVVVTLASFMIQGDYKRMAPYSIKIRMFCEFLPCFTKVYGISLFLKKNLGILVKTRL